MLLLKLFFRKPIALIRSLVIRLREDDLPSLAAQLSYYLLLAFFPFLIFMFSLLGFVKLSEEDLMDRIVLLLPMDAAKAVRSIVREVTSSPSGALLSFGLIGSVWTASGGINAMIKGLNKAYEESETRRFWIRRLISIAAMLVLALVIMLSMALLVFGQTIQSRLFPLLGITDPWSSMWDMLQWIVPLLALFFVFLLLYRIAPNRRIRWRSVVPGSVFATVAWIASSLLFAFYVNNFGHYSRTYGSLGGIIILLIWLYISSMIVLIGGELNAFVARRK
ncbi:YihY/virulence factor BrkB family protein [Cohnella lubricantis]|uniref:YihY/virulence factor BrkB family protein n=1 Tax=Cohnella lubricantis TaxID=2163172 RepID=A0A841TF33_9BACL|nr:YihY/virulence factor BrkB family protein [Cohnella lubricantis]MBB6677577.1 YihY/virulence factor BrkB family protein [Cohnella lubricantis]MBP2116537.1 membrane protein [Cohnella lubricantis]